MSVRLAAVLVLLTVPLVARADTEQDPLRAIDSCLARLDAETDVGYGRIAARCPGLARTLEESGWSAWLPKGWKEPNNDLSAGSLEELRVLLARELATRAAESRTPDVANLRRILVDLGPAGGERSGLWARFKEWLRAIFESGQRPRDDHWLDRMIDRMGLSQVAIEMITYAALALIVLLAVLIVVNELRAAGFLPASRRRAQPGDALGEPRERRRVTLRDIELAELHEKPRLMLELVTARLTDLHLLPPSGSLTVRELARSAQLRDADDRARLEELARVAERERFSAQGASPGSIEAAIEQGRILLARLQGGGLAMHAGSVRP